MMIGLGLLTLASTAAAEGPQWLDHPDTARSAAKASGHYILVDLYADWCGWCKVLEREVFTTEHFKTFAKDYVLLRVDVEDGGAGSQLQAEYEVASLPTMLILDADGIEVGSVSGFSPAARYVSRLNREVIQYEASLRHFDSVRASGDPKAMRSLAETLHRRRDGKRAAALYDRLLEGERTPEGRAMLLTMASDARRLGGDLERARANAEEAQTLATALDQPILAEQAELLKAQIAQEAGDCAHAKQSLEDFLRAHPKSPMRRQARDLLSTLRRDRSACG